MAEKLLNIGPKSAAWLRQVGVRSMDDLVALGALGVFLKVKRAGFKPSLNLLYALAGAQRGCHWTALSAEEKSALVGEVSAHDDALALAKKRITPVRDIPVEREERVDDGYALGEPGLLDPVDGPDVSDSGDSPAEDARE
jgi:DNA transformation protein